MGFTAGEDEIDISIAKVGRRFSLRGQLLSEAFNGAQAILSIGGSNHETTVSDNGEFAFEHLSPGTCNLAISGDGKQIEIAGIEIG